ncbi:equilibrative nucleoside transporter 1-like [Plodia interpunctella]|uniref:equilibrative nucleoside transporter 1-like n=1 Tax=Plodia interpunctella TaxID=58824 RepID=UPI002367E05B|nr:equilibrative nucleoside transporter 1-like [Plodia interpunctella]
MAIELEPPKDKWNLIYMTLIFLGLATLVPWNMFITAKDYFVKYKLVDQPDLADNFLAYIGWASQLPNVVFNWLNVFLHIGGNLTTRIVWSLCIETGIFIFTVMLAMLDTQDIPAVFFWVTMISVLFLNAFNAIFQNSVYGVAARLPSRFTGAILSGSNVCGTLVVFVDWGSHMFGSKRTAAIYYFITGILVLLVCLDTFLALPLNRFYRYYDTLHKRTVRASVVASAPGAPQAAQRIPYWTIAKQARVQLYNIFTIFFVTLAIFPSVHSEIKPNTDGFLGNNFVRITCFLTFNFMAMIGNITASMWQYPTRHWLSVFTTARFLFIPFFLFCNYKPDERQLPVLVTNDYVYWIGSALLGWTSGLGSSLGMMYVIGGDVPPEHASTAGMLGSATLVSGILAGLLVTYVCPLLVGV